MNMDFLNQIVEEIEKKRPGSRVRVKEVKKNNGITLKGLVIEEEENECNALPIFYLGDAFKKYQSGEEIGTLAEEILMKHEEFRNPMEIHIKDFLSFDKIKDKVIYKIVNQRLNEHWLKEIPHIIFAGDLAVVFAVLVLEQGDSIAISAINYEQVKAWGVGVEDLLEVAKKNTPKLLKWEFREMGDVLKEIVGSQATSAIGLGTNQKESFPMFVLTNNRKLYGAACIFYEGVLETIAEKLKDDFYIIPSSVHETLILPVREVSSSSELESIIREVNATQLEADDILSDHPYLYLRVSGELTIPQAKSAA